MGEKFNKMKIHTADRHKDENAITFLYDISVIFDWWTFAGNGKTQTKRNALFYDFYVYPENGLGDKVAFYWEGNDPNDVDRLTFSDLKARVCRLANALKAKGVKKGDRVAVYMPMILELPISLLACARIGAIHSGEDWGVNNGKIRTFSLAQSIIITSLSIFHLHQSRS